MKWVLTTLVLAWPVAASAQRLTLAWDASPCACAASYRLYYGTNAHSYQFVTNTGLALTQSVVLPHGGRWFFAATVVSTNGLESDFSNEVSWESKPTAPVMNGHPCTRATRRCSERSRSPERQTIPEPWFHRNPEPHGLHAGRT